MTRPSRPPGAPDDYPSEYPQDPYSPDPYSHDPYAQPEPPGPYPYAQEPPRAPYPDPDEATRHYPVQQPPPGYPPQGYPQQGYPQGSYPQGDYGQQPGYGQPPAESYGQPPQSRGPAAHLYGAQNPSQGQQPRSVRDNQGFDGPPPLPPNARQIPPEPPAAPRGSRAARASAPAGPPQPKPMFTPRRDTDGGKPRPSFTPRDGYTPPQSMGSSADLASVTTSFFAPQGYMQPSFQPSFQPREDPSPRTGPDRYAEDGDGRTQVLDRPPGQAPPRSQPLPRVRDTGPQRTADTGPNLMRSSKAMALGTIASRGSGFLRTLVLVIALGSGPLANAYNVSNTLPNTVYYLMLGGVFTSVVIPLLVKAAKEHLDKGEAYTERIFTLGAIALLAVTAIGMIFAAPVVDIYMPGATASEHHVAVLFAYMFIPQIFFYGMDSLLGAILNTKGRFGPNMWTPVINNVVVIAVFALFMVVVGQVKQTNGNIQLSSAGLDLLGYGTTLGILVQSIALFPIVRRAGFSFRLRFDFKRSELSEIGGMAGWMLGYVISQFAANLILTQVADIASTHKGAENAGYSAFAYANQLFQLPYAIVGLSVISALLPRMAGHATDRRYSLVRDDYSTGVRLASVIVVPAAVFLGVLGAPLCELLFGYGHESVSGARYIGEVFGMLSLGLVPFMLTQLQLRVFYSFHDNRTPGIIGFVMLLFGAAGDYIALNVLPASEVVIGLGAVYGLMTLVGAALAWPLLLRRVGSLDGWRITRSLIRMILATLPGLAWALVTMSVVGSFIHQGPVYGFVSMAVGGGGALALYALCARVLGIEEFRVLLRTVAGRFGR